MRGGRKGYSFCGAPAKKWQNLRPAASKIIILGLRHHQDSQAVIYIDTKLRISKVINQKILISEKGEMTNFILKECAYTVSLMLL